ncbi:cytochrome C oxidase subunit III [Herbaspirillum rubrisubalbicans]|uniref:Cytochrome C oxidase subunit III n=2 Tax=Herbaspirillum rubrisubalbicans TaxID=80842 RepID=A0ABX9C8B2_9BURK|nr:cytochrome c oxidase subunit 3 [Herbaspirillum rubrisubalbicans]MCP1572716.1 heme/copper-type cytochrome/quinol oxidase subunit 3 [Herbaspirillum rubrisubalbicans]NQE47080.1 cytochrome C oxidase subunit III [Herbaspirillum rubrisubalbicans]QJQ01302.1 cytochrome C oxidase subunit III [Herbaspirillum rubrisubalbicans Os34]RAM66963.1 cytochrome C oxidase subunit III [Herbaspirillum rubrisubalbicans]RAN49171.1 cytochrome C oxidase subunit III [Herbaspirillum rubrisubalbicans]
MNQVPETLDVSHLPTFGFGPASTTWWATLGLILIESTVFALGMASYFYLRGQSPAWPPSGVPPDLLWGSLNTLVMLLSCLPNYFASRAAKRFERQRVRRWLLLCLLFSLLFLGGRVGEFAALNVGWSDNAYGSITWMLLGLHTVHLVTDTFDSLVLTLLFFTGPLESKRYVDVSENGDYWYFVVASWLVLYVVIYWGPRL